MVGKALWFWLKKLRPALLDCGIGSYPVSLGVFPKGGEITLEGGTVPFGEQVFSIQCNVLGSGY